VKLQVNEPSPLVVPEQTLLPVEEDVALKRTETAAFAFMPRT